MCFVCVVYGFVCGSGVNVHSVCVCGGVCVIVWWCMCDGTCGVVWCLCGVYVTCV